MIAWKTSCIVANFLFILINLHDGSAFTPSSFVPTNMRLVRANDMSSRVCSSSSSQLSMRFPIISNWKVISGGRLSGDVMNHPTLQDNESITTSALKTPSKDLTSNMVVETKSGSKYRLGTPLNPPKTNPFARNGKVVPQKDNKKSSPAVIPIINNWKVTSGGVVSGNVRNHPTLSNNESITTSALKNPKAAGPQKIVETKSGSKYKLGSPAKDVKPAVKPTATKNTKVTIKAPTKNVKVEKSTMVTTTAKKTKEESIEDKLRRATKEYKLTGEAIGKGSYLLAGEPRRSTSGKSMIWTGYKADADGLPVGEALTIKISPNFVALKREADNYRKITSGLSRGMFVKFVEYLEKAGEGRSKYANQCAVIIERGDKDLKALLTERRGKGLKGKELRDACAVAASCVQGVHATGLVWTDLKAENFVAAEEKSGGLKFSGIDLESAIPVKDNPVDYSPEACPPEFAEAFMAGDGPYFTLEYSYDVWSLGVLFYELSTGKFMFGNKSPSQITKLLIEGKDIDLSAVPDDKLRSLIADCLTRDPKKRPSITQILLHPYFLTTGIGIFSF